VASEVLGEVRVAPEDNAEQGLDVRLEVAAQK